MLEKYDVSKEGIGKDRLIYCKMLMKFLHLDAKT